MSWTAETLFQVAGSRIETEAATGIEVYIYIYIEHQDGASFLLLLPLRPSVSVVLCSVLTGLSEIGLHRCSEILKEVVSVVLFTSSP